MKQMEKKIFVTYRMQVFKPDGKLYTEESFTAELDVSACSAGGYLCIPVLEASRVRSLLNGKYQGFHILLSHEEGVAQLYLAGVCNV